MRIHEGYRLSENLPAIVFDEKTADEIKMNLDCFVGDEVCMQIIRNNRAVLMSGQLIGLQKPHGQKNQIPRLVATLMSRLPQGSSSYHSHAFGANGDYTRVARVVSKMHTRKVHEEYLREGESCIQVIGRQILFENIDALEKWYELFHKRKIDFREEDYALAVKIFELSDNNWKPFYEKQ